ncbi:HAMP domain-containing histidine kinase [Subsaxibacter sp. CAU 1640]|uniref:sensor histidine kinase n=1 Tax=Subsaxibacter sp. CAU 1640 TaxID=2933271 RepID=UPI0020056A7D|nr:HAMP domain-containing sensor histidine kinase [Subsaxibacter sp. CAU 1640]MCK7590375.1 HAMP domain-containing histidine kinase [Subsaxibacter sp. CAU 1640]
MDDKKYNGILYVIVVTMLLTVAVQLYWNYNNYKVNKQRFINDVQIAFDNAIEVYYANLAEQNQMTILDVKSDSIKFTDKLKAIDTDSIFMQLRKDYEGKLDSNMMRVTQLMDSSSGFSFNTKTKNLSQVKVLRGKRASDSIKLLKGITSIFISIHDDSLKLKPLDSLVTNELKRKELTLNHALNHYRNDSLINSYNEDVTESDYLKTLAKTKFLKQNEALELKFPNATNIILKNGMFEILLSLVLLLAIISSLVYLLKIIRNQKQLAEIKNDLISNITHEFKTPISTIVVALESIDKFNALEDQQKTKTYVDLSNEQLTKLNTMVEKLLETATLDSDNLNLQMESVNVSELLETIVNKHSFQAKEKTLNFYPSKNDVFATVDVFHFENAINNVVDNAVKYGGHVIDVSITQKSSVIVISISDNGKGLTKEHKDKVFEKFYRVPQGNRHDVKGFGIGLYYTTKIIEKHGGSIEIELSDNLTTFNISIPNG